MCAYRFRIGVVPCGCHVCVCQSHTTLRTPTHRPRCCCVRGVRGWLAVVRVLAAELAAVWVTTTLPSRPARLCVPTRLLSSRLHTHTHAHTYCTPPYTHTCTRTRPHTHSFSMHVLLRCPALCCAANLPVATLPDMCCRGVCVACVMCGTDGGVGRHGVTAQW